MTLAKYLEMQELRHSDFAAQIGVSQAAVTRYASGNRMPRPAVLDRIRAVTGGLVTANDFFALVEGEAA